jgi:hypothetical protein
MSKAETVGAIVLLGCILCATPLSLRHSPEGKVSLSMDSAPAEIDAGVNRKAHRRAYRRDGYDYSRYERFSYQGFWGNYGYAYQPWWSR